MVWNVWMIAVHYHMFISKPFNRWQHKLWSPWQNVTLSNYKHKTIQATEMRWWETFWVTARQRTSHSISSVFKAVFRHDSSSTALHLRTQSLILTVLGVPSWSPTPLLPLWLAHAALRRCLALRLGLDGTITGSIAGSWCVISSQWSSWMLRGRWRHGLMINFRFCYRGIHTCTFKRCQWLIIKTWPWQ